MMNERIPTPTVGEIILEEFMQPLDLSVTTLAQNIGVSERYLKNILEGDGKVTPDISSKLGAYFGMSESFFVRLQMNLDVRES